jgi:hypothetical protein
MPSSKKKKLNHFLAVWDMYGLESLHDVLHAKKLHDEWEKAKVLAILKEEELPSQPRTIPLNVLLLRARVNSHRYYEIYEFTTPFSFQEIKNMFKEDPQTMANTVREVGYKIYSDLVEIDKRVIV